MWPGRGATATPRLRGEGGPAGYRADLSGPTSRYCPRCSRRTHNFHEHAVDEEFLKEHMHTKGKELAEACVAIISEVAAVT